MAKVWQMHPNPDVTFLYLNISETVSRVSSLLAASKAGFKIYSWKNRGLITLVGEPRNMTAYLLTRPDLDPYEIQEFPFPDPTTSTLAEDITNELHEYTGRNTSQSFRPRRTLRSVGY